MSKKNKEFYLFKWSVVLSIGVVIIALFVVGNITWVLPIKDEVESNTYELLRIKGDNVSERLAIFLDHNLNALQNGAILIDRGINNPTNVALRVLRENSSLETITLLNLEGKEVLRINPRLFIRPRDLLDRSDQELFKVLNESNMYISDLLFSDSQQPMIEFAVPLDSSTGYSGFIAQVNLKFFIDEIFEKLQKDEDENESVYIVDGKGYLIGHTSWKLVASRTNVMDRRLVQLGLEGIATDTRNEELVYKNENGLIVFASAIPIKYSNWLVVVETLNNPALQAVRRTFSIAIASFVVQLLVVIFAVWIYRSLTKAASLFYKERNQRQAIVESLADGVIEFDNDYRILFMSQKAENMLGVKFSQVSGSIITPEDLKNNPHLKILIEVMYPIISPKKVGSGKIFTTDVVDVYTSNPRKSLQVTTTKVLSDEGSSSGFLKIVHDMSREELFDRIKKDIAIIVAHQLRTPLSIMKWSIDVILKGDAGNVSKKQRGILKRISSTNENMVALVDNMLTVARIEEGSYVGKKEEADIQEILNTSVRTAIEEAKEKGVELNFKKIKESTPMLIMDAGSVRLALENIIINAVKYTPAGGSVKIFSQTENNTITIVVQDTGIGIPQDQQARVFTKFFRAKNGMKLQPNGSGLGLFIARNIIESHGGRITFSSQEGKGSTFRISLPLL